MNNLYDPKFHLVLCFWSSDGGLSGGEIAGIVIGSLAGVALIAVLGVVGVR